jgi:hypothetical protein
MMKSIKSDERGAMMLIGLIFAIFGVAILYSAIGVSQAALFRQHVQDGADAAALSGAVMQARSMNLIVLLNIVMAALLSVLVALKLVEAIAIAGIIIAGAVATPTYGGSLALIPPLETVRDKVKTIHDSLEDPITEALEAMNELSDLVAEVAPEAAGAVARGTQQTPIEEVYIGVGATLPVEDDEFRILCEEAGKLPLALAEDTLPFPKKGVLKKFVTTPLTNAMGKLAKTFSAWFCGDEGSGGSKAPSEEISDWFWYPGDETTELCGEPPVAEGEELDREVVEGLTSTYADECSERVSQAYTSGCGPVVCTLEDTYASRAELARTTCDPRKGYFTLYNYQKRSGSVPYIWNGQRWVRGIPHFVEVKYVEKAVGSPCGPMGEVSDDYNVTVHADEGSDIVSPVCSKEGAPPPFVLGESGTVITVEIEEVTHILGCARHETIPVAVDSEQAEGGEDRSPKRVVSGLSQGSEEFQVRAVAVGSPNSSGIAAAVRLALWGHEAGDSGVERLRAFGGYGVAQAEFFYDEAGSDDAWLWNMKWRARITRFRANKDQLEPLDTDCQATEQPLSSVGELDGAVPRADCSTFLDEIVRLGPLVTH